MVGQSATQVFRNQSKNKGATEYVHVIDNYLQEEVSSGETIAPFKTNPLKAE